MTKIRTRKEALSLKLPALAIVWHRRSTNKFRLAMIENFDIISQPVYKVITTHQFDQEWKDQVHRSLRNLCSRRRCTYRGGPERRTTLRCTVNEHLFVIIINNRNDKNAKPEPE
ncbi:unnamed protein product [Caenorhabditis auriculariae]|uniref:Uncharacterized protein n=1 Tax=Caenorhabditis auriculariae TaxID=2777116 RepID=A0A8S1HXY0_9PELO|nr:unnamed protein product [Caenorhabditis auriculariae]